LNRRDAEAAKKLNNQTVDRRRYISTDEQPHAELSGAQSTSRNHAARSLVGRLCANISRVSLSEHVATFIVEPLIDEYEIVIKVHSDDMPVKVTWCVFIQREFFVVQSIN
jgi:D-mannonate dehydratase